MMNMNTVETRNNNKCKPGEVYVFVEKHPNTPKAEAITLALEVLNKKYWWVHNEDWKPVKE